MCDGYLSPGVPGPFGRILEYAMSSGKNPLMLMMALAMPGAAHALGLGDIHVDSALNERLVAEIDIVGATPEELADLRAAVANRETFQHFGAERPAFLPSTTFKVTQDSRGRPVLAVRSTDPFTEPLVNFLVDLRWHNGQLVREYTLLLDPPGFGAAAPAAPAPAAPDAPAALATAAPPAATPVARRVDPPADQTAPSGAVRKTTHIKVGAKATLRGIAWRVGERSDSDLQKMMIAIFRANPSAFDGNINRLYRGAVLTIPSTVEVAAISAAEAKHEFHAQMVAWRGATRTVAVPGIAATSPTAAPLPKVAAENAAASVEPLNQRVQSLEKELSDMKGVLESEHDRLLAIQQQSERAANAAPAAVQPPLPDALPTVAAAPTIEVPITVEAQRPAAPKQEYTAALVAGLGTLAAALAALYFRIRRRVAVQPRLGSDGNMDAADAKAAVAAAAVAPGAAARDAAAVDDFAAQQVAPTVAPAAPFEHRAEEARAPAAPAADDSTNPMLPILSPVAGRSEMAAAGSTTAPHDTTVSLQVDTVNLRMASTRLDYNLVDLDMTAQHVQMPSVLNENAVVKERRTNLADVLRLAIEREPDRHDLRMKLLELYYSAAATNRQGFLDVVQKFARDRNYLESDQWDKIAFMGRQIASDNPLFAEELASDDDLANCA
jgi:pilus assembly protein FimV